LKFGKKIFKFFIFIIVIIKMSSSNSYKKKNKAALIIQKNFKKLLFPYINRVSANIYNRIDYYNIINKYLDIDESKDNYCIRFYKFSEDGNPVFRIGNNVILKNKIGSDSKYGIVYLCSFRDKNKRLYKFAVKIGLDTYDLRNEIKINKILTLATVNNKCPHFPIMYNSVKCDNFLNFDNSNFNYSKSKSKNKDELDEEIKNIKNYPQLIKNNRGYPLNSIFSELANGDLMMFIIKYHKNKCFIENALSQIFISLLFFYQETGHYHNDAHWGNFLFHKIKKGGYFHYKINGKDYYIENIGYLWVIWDFGMAKLINSRFDIRTDYHRIIGAFINRDIKKILSIDGFDEDFNDKIDKLSFVVNVKENYTIDAWINYVNTILYYLINLNLIKTKHDIPKKNDVIINNKPFIYNVK